MTESPINAAEEWRWIASVLQQTELRRDDVNEALTMIGGLRHDLDRTEHRLIGLAREGGAGWREIAESLGLRSRQAAEQRYLRLGADAEPDLGSVRKRIARRREMDARAGERAARLRAAVGGLVDELERSARRADGHGAAGRGGAGRGAAGHGEAGHGVAGHGGVGRRGAGDGAAENSVTGHGAAGQGAAGHSAIIRLALRTLRIALDSEAGALFDLAALAVSDLDGLPTQLRSPGLEAAIGEIRRALGP